VTGDGPRPDRARIVLLTVLALLAFAANSIICRVALAGGDIGAGAFTAVRIGAGAAVLGGMVAGRRRSLRAWRAGSRISALMLFLYALGFSLAYRDLAAGTGALILFGAVQATMIGAGIASGQRPGGRQWLGLGAALAGLVYLVSPGLDAPPLVGAGLMALAGVAWGVYSLRGGGADPVATTAGNFLLAVPLAALAALAALAEPLPTARGVLLGMASGGLTSGLGYVLWYAALRGLDATRAGIAQLAVPVLAAGGGVVLLAEPVTTRLILASLVTLGGVGLATGGSRSR
jgi:drug/metabolite transporter (DMT)-like permease